MNEERERTRCRNCELVQWSEQPNCRRCGLRLPQPAVRLVERVVEKIVIGHDPQCLNKLEQARQLLAEASDRLMQSSTDSALPPIPWSNGDSRQFPTLAEVERAMINAAYKRSNRKPLEAARLLGIGKTTFYRKLREMRQAA